MTFVSLPAKWPRLLKFAGVLALISALGLPAAAMAQDAASSSVAPPAAATAPAAPADVKLDSVVATVGGQTVTEADLAFAAEDLGQELANIPQDQLRAVLLTQMIDLKLMAQAGHAASLEQSDLYKLRLQYLEERALRRAYTKQAISDAITPEAIKAAYDQQVAAMPAEDEVHARHILVTTEDDAKAIKAQLDGGADFATLAKDKSIEPGAKQSGGDLGYFTAGQMVKPFADAAFKLAVNQVSDPVQTQFGWHVIQVLDKRPAAKPTLEALTPQIGQELYVQKYRAMFDQLKGAATIDIPDAALKAQVDAQLAPPPAGTTPAPAEPAPAQ